MSYANVLTNSSLVSSLVVSDLTMKGSTRSGSGVMNGATPVVVACLSIKATDSILLTPIGANPATPLPLVFAIVAGASFSVASVAGDVRPFNYVVISTV